MGLEKLHYHWMEHSPQVCIMEKENTIARLGSSSYPYRQTGRERLKQKLLKIIQRNHATSLLKINNSPTDHLSQSTVLKPHLLPNQHTSSISQEKIQGRNRYTHKMNLEKYLETIKQRDCQKDGESHLGTDSDSVYPNMSQYSRAPNHAKTLEKVEFRRRKDRLKIPTTEIQGMITEVYKGYSTIMRLGYNFDQVVGIIRQICSKRKNIEGLLLNRKQKPKTVYYTFEVKKENECMEAIIIESFEHRGGKFEGIFRDLSNFCIFFEDELVERGKLRIREIKKSIVQMKSALECNEYSSQLGFNNLLTGGEEEDELNRKRMFIHNRHMFKYVSSVNKNIDQELVKVEDEMGGFLQQNRGFVEALAKFNLVLNK